jgi:hypothetical protein
MQHPQRLAGAIVGVFCMVMCAEPAFSGNVTGHDKRGGTGGPSEPSDPGPTTPTLVSGPSAPTPGSNGGSSGVSGPSTLVSSGSGSGSATTGSATTGSATTGSGSGTGGGGSLSGMASGGTVSVSQSLADAAQQAVQGRSIQAAESCADGRGREQSGGQDDKNEKKCTRQARHRQQAEGRGATPPVLAKAAPPVVAPATYSAWVYGFGDYEVHQNVAPNSAAEPRPEARLEDSISPTTE